LPEFHLLMLKSILFLVLFSFRALGGRLTAKNEHFFLYFFLDKKVQKNQERKDIQHFSFIRLEVAALLL